MFSVIAVGKVTGHWDPISDKWSNFFFFAITSRLAVGSIEFR